jgi:hypothetical protein
MRKLTALSVALSLSAAGQAFAGPPHAPAAHAPAANDHASIVRSGVTARVNSAYTADSNAKNGTDLVVTKGSRLEALAEDAKDIKANIGDAKMTEAEKIEATKTEVTTRPIP